MNGALDLNWIFRRIIIYETMYYECKGCTLHPNTLWISLNCVHFLDLKRQQHYSNAADNSRSGKSQLLLYPKELD